MRNKKYHTVRTISKSNSKIVERSKIDISNTQIHDPSLSWFNSETWNNNEKKKKRFPFYGAFIVKDGLLLPHVHIYKCTSI